MQRVSGAGERHESQQGSLPGNFVFSQLPGRWASDDKDAFCGRGHASAATGAPAPQLRQQRERGKSEGTVPCAGEDGLCA